MKAEGKTIPSPKNIKRREAYLLAHSDKLPKTYVQAQLLKIAMIRGEKRLRWDMPNNLKLPDMTVTHREERIKETEKAFQVVKPNMIKRTLDWIKPKISKSSQRGQ